MAADEIPPRVSRALDVVSKWRASGKQAPGSFRYRAHAKVTHVEDGDTWSGSHKPDPQIEMDRADDVWYRLSRIDTHETDADDPKKRKKAKREKQFVKQWIEQGQQAHDGEWPFVIEYESQEFEGTYGRLLVDLVRKADGTELNDALLAEFGDEIRYEG